ncbi:MAG: hypothetical protein AAF823_06375 [Planctomycetota bacterium]
MPAARIAVARIGNLMVVLAAGVWLGSILTFGLSAGSTFGTVRALHPSLTDPTPGTRPADAPDFTDVPFDVGQPNYLAGRIVNELTGDVLVPVSIGCFVVMALGLAIRQTVARKIAWVSGGLGLVAVGCFAGAIYVQIEMAARHEKMYDPRTPHESRQTLRSEFDNRHKTSERLFGVIALTQLALIAVVTLWPLPPVKQQDQAAPQPGDA